MKDINNKIGYLNDNFKIFHIRDKKDIKFEYHHHDFSKIVILIDGDLTYYIEGKAYILKPWDILFINKNEIHKPVINPNKYYERIVIWLNPDFMAKYAQGNNNLLKCFEVAIKNNYNLLRLNIKSIEIIKNIIQDIQGCDNSNEFGSEILKESLFVQLMVLMNRLFLNSDKNRDMEDIQYDKTIEGVLNYINSNLENDLSIDTIASNFFISKYYLMRKFKSQIGSSIHNYIIQKRLILAKSLISEGLTMSNVCSKCGFNDYSSFVRAFKKVYGVSPSNYNPTIHNFENPISDT
ncbi:MULTISPECIES: AraC family transcriptional regulator [Romboutsia]|jgi:AraC-like DNA-binding protein/quercetin dioxygenase-like cupin family protein|uniref:AraC family transcriptional regulator n=1 Tax=Romboutsia TaxID=1501226 RepID=UPI00216C7252|nr:MULTISPECIES: AraC family transcriptional regulator [Romboutsia]MCI9060803.1 AraC family transcriptional regulator [Romboutsia sp.]